MSDRNGTGSHPKHRIPSYDEDVTPTIPSLLQPHHAALRAVWKPLTTIALILAVGWGAHAYLSDHYATRTAVKTIEGANELAHQALRAEHLGHEARLVTLEERAKLQAEQLRWQSDRLYELAVREGLRPPKPPGMAEGSTP